MPNLVADNEEEGIAPLLERVCRRSFGSAAASDSIRQITTGWECEVWAFDLVSNGGRPDLKLILRLYHGFGAAQKAEAESAMLQILQGSFPIPEVLASGQDEA